MVVLGVAERSRENRPRSKVSLPDFGKIHSSCNLFDHYRGQLFRSELFVNAKEVDFSNFDVLLIHSQL